MYLSNLVVMWGVANGLHLYFTPAHGKQETQIRSTPSDEKGKQFTFCGQVKDNMFRTLVSGVSIRICYAILIFWAIANNHAPMLQRATNPIQFMVLSLIIRLL